MSISARLARRFALERALAIWLSRCNPQAQTDLLADIVEQIGYSPN